MSLLMVDWFSLSHPLQCRGSEEGSRGNEGGIEIERERKREREGYRERRDRERERREV